MDYGKNFHNDINSVLSGITGFKKTLDHLKNNEFKNMTPEDKKKAEDGLKLSDVYGKFEELKGMKSQLDGLINKVK